MGLADDIANYHRKIRNSLPPDSGDKCLTYEEWSIVYAFVVNSGALAERMNKALFDDYSRAFEILERKRLRYPDNHPREG